MKEHVSKKEVLEKIWIRRMLIFKITKNGCNESLENSTHRRNIEGKRDTLSNWPNKFAWKDGRTKTKSDGSESNIALRYKEQEMVENHSHLHPEGIRYIKEDRLALSETIGWKQIS